MKRLIMIALLGASANAMSYGTDVPQSDGKCAAAISKALQMAPDAKVDTCKCTLIGDPELKHNVDFMQQNGYSQQDITDFEVARKQQGDFIAYSCDTPVTKDQVFGMIMGKLYLKELTND